VYEYLSNNCGRVLDFGCGDGEFIGGLSSKTLKLYGLDVDREKVKRARERYPFVKFSNIKTAGKLPYKNNFFDAVFMFHVLEHVDSEEEAIGEIYRILKKNGRFYLASPHRGLFTCADTANLRFRFPRLHRWFFITFLGEDKYRRRFVDRKKEKLFGDCSINRKWHKHYKEKEIRELLKKGFVIEEFKKFSLFHPFLLVLNNIWSYFFKTENLIIEKLIDWDNRLMAGELSYNILAVARKK
jgi:ubiquinone/menaquinone biosynthesis C-methylase UbiE